jgi:hypothetical protein
MFSCLKKNWEESYLLWNLKGKFVKLACLCLTLHAND